MKSEHDRLETTINLTRNERAGKVAFGLMKAGSLNRLLGGINDQCIVLMKAFLKFMDRRKRSGRSELLLRKH